MAKIYVDSKFAKQFGLTDKDFEGKDMKAQKKVLEDAMKKYSNAFFEEIDEEAFKDVKDLLAKTKEAFKNTRSVYVKAYGAKSTASLASIIGYVEKTKRFVIFSPDTKSNEKGNIKPYQVDESDILLTKESYHEYQKSIPKKKKKDEEKEVK